MWSTLLNPLRHLQQTIMQAILASSTWSMWARGASVSFVFSGASTSSRLCFSCSFVELHLIIVASWSPHSGHSTRCSLTAAQAALELCPGCKRLGVFDVWVRPSTSKWYVPVFPGPMMPAFPQCDYGCCTARHTEVRQGFPVGSPLSSVLQPACSSSSRTHAMLAPRFARNCCFFSLQDP